MGKEENKTTCKAEYKTTCNVYGIGVAGTTIELIEKEAAKYGKSIVLSKQTK